MTKFRVAESQYAQTLLANATPDDGLVTLMDHRCSRDLGRYRLDLALEQLAEGASVAWDVAGHALDPNLGYAVGLWVPCRFSDDADDVEHSLGCLVPTSGPHRRWRGWRLCRLVDGSLAWRERITRR